LPTTPDAYTLSLHDALPISLRPRFGAGRRAMRCVSKAFEESPKYGQRSPESLSEQSATQSEHRSKTHRKHGNAALKYQMRGPEEGKNGAYANGCTHDS